MNFMCYDMDESYIHHEPIQFIALNVKSENAFLAVVYVVCVVRCMLFLTVYRKTNKMDEYLN